MSSAPLRTEDAQGGTVMVSGQGSTSAPGHRECTSPGVRVQIPPSQVAAGAVTVRRCTSTCVVHVRCSLEELTAHEVASVSASTACTGAWSGRTSSRCRSIEVEYPARVAWYLACTCHWAKRKARCVSRCEKLKINQVLGTGPKHPPPHFHIHPFPFWYSTDALCTSGVPVVASIPIPGFALRVACSKRLRCVPGSLLGTTGHALAHR